MKNVLCIILLLCSLSCAAQQNLRIDLYAGSGIVRLHRFSIKNTGNGSIDFNTMNPQSGMNIGVLLSRKSNTLITPLFGIGVSRNIVYATLKHFIPDMINGGQMYYTRNVHYLRWDMTRGELSMQIQAAFGPQKDIRLTGGIMVTSLLLNRSRTNYWYEEQGYAYNYNTGTTTNFYETTLYEEGLKAPQLAMALTGGTILPIVKSRISLAANWRFTFTKNETLFWLAEKGVNLSLVYSL
ncbi:MAG: hypothetical protein IM638_13440 [Bacteroidetes bacterium]|nr:hypothetical protein [Bacteroidota bacterium]